MQKKILGAIDSHFKYIVIALMAVQTLKGVGIYQSAYSRSQYLWSYTDGFVKRGFFGTFVFFFVDHENYRLLGIINFFSYFFYFLFLFLLYRFILKNAQSAMQKTVAVLFLASPFLIAVGSLLGYFDLVILSLLLILYNFYDKKNLSLLPCFLVVTIGLLIHEMSLFFLVIPLLYLTWTHPYTPLRKKYYLIGGIAVICAIYLLMIWQKNTAFLQVLDDRISEYKHVLATKQGEESFAFFADYALKNNFLHDVYFSRLLMLVVLLPIYAFFILMSNWFVLPELLKTKKYKDALFYLIASYAPLLIIVAGWDLDRFVCEGILTAYISFVAITKNYPIIIERKPGKLQLITVAALSIIALLTYYPISDYCAEEETLLSKNQQKTMLHYPDKIIKFWIAKNWKNNTAPQKNTPHAK